MAFSQSGGDGFDAARAKGGEDVVMEALYAKREAIDQT
jgi:hypothetical protein